MSYPYMAFVEQYATRSGGSYVPDYNYLYFATKKSGVWETVVVDEAASSESSYFTGWNMVANNGPLFGIVSYNEGDGNVIYISNDEGKTWTKHVSEEYAFARNWFTCVNGLFALTEGRDYWHVSSDLLNWETIEWDNETGDAYYKEWSYVDDRGVIHILMNGWDANEATWYSSSNDLRHWTEPIALFPDGQAYEGIGITGYGKYIIATVWTEDGYEDLQVRVSQDYGKTWGTVQDIHLPDYLGAGMINFWLTREYTVIIPMIKDDTLYIMLSWAKDSWDAGTYDYWEMHSLECSDITAETLSWSVHDGYPIQSWWHNNFITDPISRQSWHIMTSYTSAVYKDGAWDDEDAREIATIEPDTFATEQIFTTPIYYDWPITSFASSEGERNSRVPYSPTIGCYRVFQKGFAYLF